MNGRLLSGMVPVQAKEEVHASYFEETGGCGDVSGIQEEASVVLGILQRRSIRILILSNKSKWLR